jgi:hypothetical protein
MLFFVNFRRRVAAVASLLARRMDGSKASRTLRRGSILVSTSGRDRVIPLMHAYSFSRKSATPFLQETAVVRCPAVRSSDGV